MIDQQRLDLEYQKYHESKRQTKENTNSNDRLQGTLMQEKENWSNKDKRNISPEVNDYDIPNFNITKGGNLKINMNKGLWKCGITMNLEKIMKWKKPKYKENHSSSHLTTS